MDIAVLIAGAILIGLFIAISDKVPYLSIKSTYLVYGAYFIVLIAYAVFCTMISNQPTF